VNRTGDSPSESDDSWPRRRGSVKGVAAALFVSQALAVCVSPLVARALGAAERGELALVVAMNDASTTFFNVGVASAVGYFALRGGRSDDRSLTAAAWRFSLLLTPFSVGLSAMILWADLGQLHTEALVILAVSVAVSPLVNTMGLVYRQLLLARRDLAGMRNVTLLVSLARTMGLAVAVISGEAALLVALVASVMAEYLGSMYARRRLHLARTASRFSAMQLLRFGVKAAPGSLANFANARLDQLIIVAMVDTRALGVYAVAVAVNTIPLQLGSALAYGAFGSGAIGDASREPYAAAIRRSTVVAMLACVATAIGTIALLEPAYGNAFSGSVSPALLLLPGTFAFAVFLTQQQVSVAIGHPGMESVAQSVSLLLTIPGLLLLVPAFSIEAAAVVSSVACVVRVLVMAFLLRRAGVSRCLPKVADAKAVVKKLSGLLPRKRRQRSLVWVSRQSRRDA
jgi:O-antigen/teichoic acid export membrane protein